MVLKLFNMSKGDKDRKINKNRSTIGTKFNSSNQTYLLKIKTEVIPHKTNKKHFKVQIKNKNKNPYKVQDKSLYKVQDKNPCKVEKNKKAYKLADKKAYKVGYKKPYRI